jgi:hypothetical protein
MKRALFVIVLLTCCGVHQAQEKKSSIGAFGGETPDERASTRVLYWDSAKDSAAGEFAIDYGRPVWKKEYDDPAKFDSMTKGKVWRMGNNFWTVLDTSLPLKFVGKEVPIGSYYLGIYRSSDGNQWSLAFIDPVKVRAARLDGFQIEKTPVQFKVPITFEVASTPAEKLTVTFQHEKDKLGDVTMKVVWGKMTLTTPIQVVLTE